MDLHDDFEKADAALETWGRSILVKTGPTSVVSHVPFYRTLHYPDILDLRHCGYEISDFAPIFELLDDALVSQAQTVHKLLHQPGGNAIWNPYRARQIEFNVRAALHRFGKSDAPILLRRIIGRVYPGDSVTHLAVDMLNVFFWGAMAQMARDLAWRVPQLDAFADYLEYPIKVAFGHESEAIERAA
jgi:hypothetical protein